MESLLGYLIFRLFLYIKTFYLETISSLEKVERTEQITFFPESSENKLPT